MPVQTDTEYTYAVNATDIFYEEMFLSVFHRTVKNWSTNNIHAVVHMS